MNKIGLSLAGGGTKGSYQIGSYMALVEAGYKFDIITGTSIGALNGCMLVQDDFDVLFDFWKNLSVSDIIAGDIDLELNIESLVNKSNLYSSFLKQYVKNKGANIEPLKANIEKMFNKEKFEKSKIDFSCVSVEYPSLKPFYTTKEDMKEAGADYLLASASCFPAFPIHTYKEKSFIDGGYFDNLPIYRALEMGATELFAIDLNTSPIHKEYLERPNITYIFPKFSLGSFLKFDEDIISKNIKAGYNDTMKALNKLEGHAYTFKNLGCDDFFNRMYFEILNIEHELDTHSTFKNETYISDYFKNKQFKSLLTERNINYGIIDELMSLLDLDYTHVYTFEQMAYYILNGFKDAFKKGYEILPDLSLGGLKKFASEGGKLKLVKIMVHQLINNKEAVQRFKTVFAIEYLLAVWLIRFEEYVRERI